MNGQVQGVVENDSVRRVLAQVTMVGLLFPYLSLVPMGSDVQPFGFLVAIGCLALVFLMQGRIHALDIGDLILLGAGYVYAFYADWRVQDLDLLFLRKHAVLLIAFPAYLAAKQLYPFMARRTVVMVALAYLVITLTQGYAPGAYEAFSSVLMPRVAARSADRGLSGPCPEPSFLAFIAIGLPIFYRTLPLRGPEQADRVQYRVLVAVCVLLVVLARSVTGTLLGMALVGSVWLVGLPTWRKRALAVGAGLVLAVIGATFAEQLLGPRIGRLLKLAATNPALVLLDASIASRYVQIVGGTYVAATHPIGTGRSVGDPEVFDMASRGLGFREYVPPRSMQYIQSNRTESGNIAVLSPFGDSLSRMGIIFLLMMVALLAALRVPGVSTASRIFVAFGIISSFPLSFTPFWLLLGMHAGWSRWACRPPERSLTPVAVPR